MQKVQARDPLVQRTISGRALTVLTGAVLLAHVVVLQNTPRLLASDEPPTLRAFSTRTVQVRAAPLPPAEAPPAPAPIAPVRSALAPTPTVPRPPAPVTEVSPAAQALQPVVIPTPELPRYDLAAPLATQAPAPLPTPAASAAVAAPSIVAAAAAPPTAPAAGAPPLPKDPALQAHNYTVPGSVRLKFNASGQRSKMNYAVQGELLWLHDGKNYEARLEAGAFMLGSRISLSSGLLTADGLAPNRYSEKTKGEQAAHFERDKGKITFSANTPDSALLPGAQDRLSIFIQLAAMLAGEPAKFPVGTTISMQTASQRAADTWIFVVEAEEKLSLPGGPQDSIKLVRVPRKEFDQKVELWMAPQLGYLPARIRITEANGDFLDFQWRSTAAP